jgi:hypothetical protein
VALPLLNRVYNGSIPVPFKRLIENPSVLETVSTMVLSYLKKNMMRDVFPTENTARVS